MSNQSEALRLADWCDTFNTVQHSQCAAELRRLHAENERLRAQHASALLDTRIARAQRDGLLEALKRLTVLHDARAAIKAVEGEQT